MTWERPASSQIQFVVEHKLPETVVKFDEHGNEYLGHKIDRRTLNVEFGPEGTGKAAHVRGIEDRWELYKSDPLPLDRLVAMMRRFLDTEGGRPEGVDRLEKAWDAPVTLTEILKLPSEWC